MFDIKTRTVGFAFCQPQKKSLPKSLTQKKSLQNFKPKKSPQIANFKPKKGLRTSPSLIYLSTPPGPICDPAARTGTKMQLHGLRLNCFVRLANALLGVAGTYKAGGSYACSCPLRQIAYLSACYEGYQLPRCSRLPVPVCVRCISGAITKILSDFITGNYVNNREHYCLCNLLFICKNVRARSCFGANYRDLYCMLQHVLMSVDTDILIASSILSLK